MRNFLHLLIGIACLCLNVQTWAQNVQSINILEVQIRGLPREPLQNVLTQLTEKQKSLQDHFTDKVLVQCYRSIPAEIKNSISPFGYFKSTIQTHIQRKGNVWLGQFQVRPGPQLRFTSLDFKLMGPGQHDPVFEQLHAHFPVVAGDYFSSKKYEEAKQDLFTIASAYGYFQAKMIKSAVYINLSTYEAHVVIYFFTGPRHYFGHTYFSHTPFNQQFLNRFLMYKQGEYYVQSKVQKTRADLANSNYFQQVIVTPQSTQATDQYVPIEINLTSQLKKQYTFGLGYGTDTNVRGLIGLDYRWLNQWGHRFNTYLRGSKYNSEAVANYYIPGANPATDQYIFTAGYLNQNQITGKGNSIRGSFTYQTMLLGWQHSISLTALREIYNLINFPKTNSNLLFPTYTLQRIHYDNLMRPQ